MTRSTESLEQKVENLEVYKQEQEEAMVNLQNYVTVLRSASSDATRELQFEVKNNLLELKSIPKLEKLNHAFFQEEREAGGDDTTEHQKSLLGNKYLETAEKLLFSVRKAQTLIKFFDVTSNIATSTIQDLHKKLQEATTTIKKTIDVRDLHQSKVSKLEADVVALKCSCRELRLNKAKVEKLKEMEAEISLLYDRLSMKKQEAEDFLLSPSQMRTLVEIINGIKIPYAESVGDVETESSAEVKKLFSIINSVTKLQHQINLTEHEKQELQLTISTQTAEIEHLNGEVETHIRNKPDFENMKLDFCEFTFGLEKIVNMLGSNEIIVNQKFVSPKGLLTMLEKQIMSLWSEAENSKSKVQELDSKLFGNQKSVDELTTKVNLPEDSFHGSAVQPEIVQERSVFEERSLPSGSEISEVEDAGTLGQKTISPVSSAAHRQTMRKGSTDHLAINIDAESAPLINNEETNEDKGHLFRSLNTSGLIPKQGKMIAS